MLAVWRVSGPESARPLKRPVCLDEALVGWRRLEERGLMQDVRLRDWTGTFTLAFISLHLFKVRFPGWCTLGTAFHHICVSPTGIFRFLYMPGPSRYRSMPVER